MRKLMIFFAVVMVMMASCGKSYEEKQRINKAERARQDSIRRAAFKVAVMPTLDCLPMFYAKEQGYFDSLGIDVRLMQYDAQMDCDTALIGGSVEGSITDLVRAERLQKKGIALDYRIATNTYWQLIASHRARINNLSQLSDKIMAITRYSATDFLSTRVMDSVKLKSDLFKVQINSVKIRLDMLRNNLLDAAFLTEPQATTARVVMKEAGAKNPVLADSRDKGVRLGVIAFRSKPLEEKRRQEQLSLFLKAYDRACDSINKNGLVKMADIIEKYCGSDDKTIKALPKLNFTHATPPRQKDIDIAKSVK